MYKLLRNLRKKVGRKIATKVERRKVKANQNKYHVYDNLVIIGIICEVFEREGDVENKPSNENWAWRLKGEMRGKDWCWSAKWCKKEREIVLKGMKKWRLIEIMNSLGKSHIDGSLEQKRKALKEYVAIESALNKKIEILSTVSLQL